MTQRFDKLVTLLKELFQLDQPDLDFGFYRIMHAKSAEVTQFLERDLLPQVKAAFAQYEPADKAGIEKELAKAIEQARALGADPETLPKMKELRARLADEAIDLDALSSRSTRSAITPSVSASGSCRTSSTGTSRWTMRTFHPLCGKPASSTVTACASRPRSGISSTD